MAKPTQTQPAVARKLCRWLVVAMSVGAMVVPLLMFSYLAVSSNGDYGEVVANADELKSKYPRTFAAVMHLVQLPVNNAGAEEYFRRQKPRFAKAARTFKLHPYFAHTEVPPGDRLRWHDMIRARVSAMAALLPEQDGFKIEKDRCVMYDFLERNAFPICGIIGRWRDKSVMVRDIATDTIGLANRTQWPVFAKACHLTQSSSQGTRPFASHAALLEAVRLTPSWFDVKWAFRANDWDRVWSAEGNRLTSGLSPGFLLQGPMDAGAAWRIRGRVAVGMLEIRVEVFWGRAYLGILDGSVVIRRDGVIETYTGVNALIKKGGAADERVAWITEGGYMQCVWDLAERAARVMAIDALRVDIFLNNADKDACVINEFSLSSGLLYWGHERFMASVWAAPLRTGRYRTLNTTKAVYELDERDITTG